MNGAWRIGWMVLIAVVAAGVALTARGYVVARERAQLGLQRTALVARQVRELERARPVMDQWRQRRRPASGLAANLGQTLAACGLAPGALANVTPQPETPVHVAARLASHSPHAEAGTADLRRQRASFTLTPITLPQLGAFLEAWRTREPFWTVTSIEVAPEANRAGGGGVGGGGGAAAGGDLPLRVVVVVDAVYLAEPKETRQ